MPSKLPTDRTETLARATHVHQAPRSTLPVLLALALWLTITLGARPLLLPDEGRYGEVARSMLHGGPWVPTLNGLPFFHKPPLFYWLDAAAMQWFGSHALTARVGSAAGAWLMGASLLLALQRFHGAAMSRRALVVLATTPFFFIGGQYANHDMLVGGLITAAIFALARALESRDAIAKPWLLAGWALCGFSVLAKGLIGLVLPAVVIGPWLLAQGRWKQMLRLLDPLGLAVFIAIAAPWMIAMQLRYPGFFDYFIVEQHFRRFAQSTFNNVHGVWFFLVLLPVLTLPWSAWLPSAARQAWGQRRALPGLYAWWVVAVVGFFSIPSSKLAGYVLPALAPWCALLALAMGDRAPRRWLALAAGCACLLVVGWFAWLAPESNRALARTLGEQRGPQDSVVMIDQYLYDVPFYAQLDQPVQVASDWTDPQLPLHDNWRKELFDAARFDPVLGRELLIPLTGLERLACGPHPVWFIVATPGHSVVERMPFARRVYGDPREELWHVDARACH